MTCDNCRLENQHLRGAIIAGKYGQYCSKCLEKQTRQANAGSAAYSRDHDRATHAADMLQPWDGKGNPNTEFIRNYPAEAQDMFSAEELAQYG